MTAWENEWEAKHRRQRWIERDGYFYPRGTPLSVIELDVAKRRAERIVNGQIASRARKRLAVSVPAPAQTFAGAA